MAPDVGNPDVAVAPPWQRSWRKRVEVSAIAHLSTPLLRWLGATWRWRVEGEERLRRAEAGGAHGIHAFWHGRILHGTLHFRDVEHRFSVSGLSVADVGVARVTASGEVFGLTDLAKFPGTYQGVDVGVAVGGGTSGIALRNEHGVQLRLRAVQQGIRFSLASKGMTVTLEQ